MPPRRKVIPRAEWRRFVRDFGAAHRGWLVSIASRGQEPLPAPGGDLPLEGLSLQSDGRDDVVAVVTRRDDLPHGHLLSSIASPVEMILEEAGGQEEKTLRIESAGHERTVLRLRPAPMPDQAGAVK